MTDTTIENPLDMRETDNSLSPFARAIYLQKYAFKDDEGNPIEEWPDTAERVANNVMAALGYGPADDETLTIRRFITERKFLPGGRYLYASGRELHQVNNCLLFRADDSREGWADLAYKTAMSLMTGAGIGVVYSDVRPKGSPISKTGGEASGPISLMQIVNEQGRHYMQGGSRRSAIWAGLHWWHADVLDFIRVKDWSPELRAIKEKDFNFPAPMELTNISVILDDDFFRVFEDEQHALHGRAVEVYVSTIKRMLKTGEPGFSIDTGGNGRENLRNACTEVSSEDDSDICNLGSINLAQIESIEELRDVVDAAILFLLAGTEYSHVPFDKVKEVRSKNRRLGLGIMGVHEWLLKRGYCYGPSDELGTWLDVYAESTVFARRHANSHGLTPPIKTRAIAPTGTIGIIAETTTGIEPIFCVAYKRRYVSGEKWLHQFVIDPTAARLIHSGVDPNSIEDAYRLSYDVERRVAFQAWVQQYVDHGISSTINLPYSITDEWEIQDFAKMLIKYLPNLRGITVYPDGARGGQPLSVVPYEVAVSNTGVVFESDEATCSGGICGV